MRAMSVSSKGSLEKFALSDLAGDCGADAVCRRKRMLTSLCHLAIVAFSTPSRGMYRKGPSAPVEVSLPRSGA